MKWKNKWRRLPTVQCKTCDYCGCFEGDDEWFCAHSNKANDYRHLDISRKRLCKHYFPRENTDTEETDNDT